MPHLQRRGRGDLFVTLHVVTPRDLSKEERSLLERLAELRGEAGGGNGGAPRAAPKAAVPSLNEYAGR